MGRFHTSVCERTLHTRRLADGRAQTHKHTFIMHNVVFLVVICVHMSGRYRFGWTCHVRTGMAWDFIEYLDSQNRRQVRYSPGSVSKHARTHVQITRRCRVMVVRPRGARWHFSWVYRPPIINAELVCQLDVLHLQKFNECLASNTIVLFMRWLNAGFIPLFIVHIFINNKWYL